MIYLDYSANTPPKRIVLQAFCATTEQYMANPNSSHNLGKEAKAKIDTASELIGLYFNADKESVIYTSGASESNNLVIKGIADLRPGSKILISEIEHSSIIAPCNYLLSKGYDVDFIHIKENGQIDLEELKNKIDNNTCLVSICSVDSELGVVQPIDEIGEIVSKYPNCYFHTDATQAIGKIHLNYDKADFVTFAPHKFFGLNGTGALINRNNVRITPLIHGGKSTTPFRSGTPIVANAVAMQEALHIAEETLESSFMRYKVAELKYILTTRLIDELGDRICINSPVDALPHVLNISLTTYPAKDAVNKLSEKEIYVSSSSACSLDNVPSKAVLALTKDEELAKNTIRISLSHLTLESEIETFVDTLKDIIIKSEINSNK